MNPLETDSNESIICGLHIKLQWKSIALCRVTEAWNTFQCWQRQLKMRKRKGWGQGRSRGREPGASARKSSPAQGMWFYFQGVVYIFSLNLWFFSAIQPLVYMRTGCQGDENTTFRTRVPEWGILTTVGDLLSCKHKAVFFFNDDFSASCSRDIGLGHSSVLQLFSRSVRGIQGKA